MADEQQEAIFVTSKLLLLGAVGCWLWAILEGIPWYGAVTLAGLIILVAWLIRQQLN